MVDIAIMTQMNYQVIPSLGRAFLLNVPSVQTKLVLKDNTLTFDNAYKEAVAEELAAKCSIEFNVSSSGGNGTSHATASANQVG